MDEECAGAMENLGTTRAKQKYHDPSLHLKKMTYTLLSARIPTATDMEYALLSCQ